MTAPTAITRKLFIFLCFTALQGICITVFCKEAHRQPDYILILNSYTEASPWSNNYIAHIHKALPQFPGDLNVHTEHMNMLLMDTPDQLNDFTGKILRKYGNRPPAALIFLDNPAYSLLNDTLRGIWKETPFILSAKEAYTGPAAFYLDKSPVPVRARLPIPQNDSLLYTMYAPVYLEENVALIKRMLPRVDTLLFLSDKRYISAQYRADLEKICKKDFPELILRHLIAEDITESELAAELDRNYKNTGLLYFSWYRKNQQGNNNIISVLGMDQLIGNYTQSPVFTLQDTGIGDGGMLGKYFHTPGQLGETLEKMIGNILAGHPQDHWTVPPKATPVFNYLTLINKGLKEADCPPNTVFYMKPPTAWEQHGYRVLVISAVIILLIITLLLRIKMLNNIKKEQLKRLEIMTDYRSLVKNMPIGYLKGKIIFNQQGEIADYIFTAINPYFESYFAAADKILGKKASELNYIDHPRNTELCNRAFQTNKQLSVQYYHEATGKFFTLMLTLSESKEYIEIFGVDNTELAQTQQKLRTVNHKLAMSLDVANIIPWKWDLVNKKILCDINKPVELSLENDMVEEDQISVPDYLYFSKILKEDRERVKLAYQNLIEGKTNKIKEEYRVVQDASHKHFDWIEAQAVVDKRDEQGRPLSLIGSSLVITGRKIMQEELLKAKEEAETSNRLKSQFLANMSHEIRTPLNAIVGFSGILASTENEQEKIEYLNIIENNNTLLLQLIGDILDLSKIESGNLEFSYSDVDLNKFLNELLQSFRLRMKDSPVDLLLKCGTEGEYWIYTEKNRLIQVLMNLLSNAQKFTRQGSIRFGYEPPRDGFLRFYVRDTGCGIPEEKRKSVFERFVKLNTFAQGTGLGLSICRTIVNHLGGEIGVESAAGQGAEFWFTLPYNPGTKPAEENEPVIVQEAVRKDKLTILIAEDNPGNYRLFESILRQEYRLLHAWDGAEAVNLYKQYKPHLILMDINMPNVDGYEATRMIRNVSATVPIIAVTAYAYTSDEQRIMKSGFNDYSPKPINADKLKEQILHLLKKRLIFIY